MIKLIYLILSVSLILYSCNMKSNKESIAIWKQEIRETEQNFAKMVQEEGIHKAFISFADENAVLMRNNDLVIGKERIDIFYKKQTSKNLEWTPDFVDVAGSGDLGYTYGHYIFTHTDSSGSEVINTGVFHTVWKRQPSGIWKFVWD